MTGRLLLLGRSDPGLWERTAALAPELRLVSRDEVREDPGLIPLLEAAYGGLRREDLVRADSLRWLQTAGAGINGLLPPERIEGPLVVTNASGIHAEPIAEHLFGMLLLRVRRLDEALALQQRREWKGGPFHERVEMLAGRTLGVLGVGAIGAQCARVGRAFGMRVIGLRRSGEPHPEVERTYGPGDVCRFLAECDVVMNLLPLTDETRGFLSWKEFAACRPGIVLLNAGRGATVDTLALVAALREGRVGAAMLDVTDPEPLPPDHPLWVMENVYLTAHYSGSHPGYFDRADAIFLDNLRRYLAGEPLRNVVDRRAGY